jgi:tyrosinase
MRLAFPLEWLTARNSLTVNVGPLSQSVPGVPPNPQADGLGYNPRCIRRDVNKNYATLTRANYTYDLITKNNNVYWMQTVMEGQLDMGLLGVHISGHQTIGGDPAGDFYSSPGDPAFWLHHGMIDRVWWIWQNLDLEKRLKDVSMTMTMFNNPPTRNGTLEDSFDLGLLAGEWKMKDLMSTLGGLGGEMCYVYV